DSQEAGSVPAEGDPKNAVLVYIELVDRFLLADFPDLCQTFQSTGGKAAGVVKRDAVNPALVSLQQRYFARGGQVPNSHLTGADPALLGPPRHRRGREALAVVAEGDVADLDLHLETRKLLVLPQVPDAHDAIVAAGREPRAVGVEGDGPDRLAVGRQ